MPRDTEKHFSKPSRPIAQPSHTRKSQSESHHGTKSNQPSNLLFVNFSDPSNESKRQDRRKAVRSFVMKQYRQSKKTPGPLRIQQVAFDSKGNADTTKEPQAMGSPSSAEESPQSSHSLPEIGEDDQDAEDVFRSSRQLGIALPNQENAAGLVGPLSVLGNGSLDPFDAYPARVDTPAQKLLDLYLNTQGVFPDSQAFNQESRRRTWFPLSCSSKALFHGLIASAASACTVQQIGGFEPLVLRHQQQALLALNETLGGELSIEESTATIFAIKTMLLVAMHEGNTRAMRMHFQGAVAVVHRHGSPYKMGRLAQQIVASFACWTSFAPPSTHWIPFAELVWSSAGFTPGVEKDFSVAMPVHNTQNVPLAGIISSAKTSSSNTYGKQNPLSTPQASPDLPTSRPFRPQSDPRHYSRTLSPVLRKECQRITDLSLLACRARNFTISLQEQAELMAGICCGGQRLASISRSGLSPLEDCIRITTLIHFFADVVPFDEGDEPRILHLTESVKHDISSVDLDLLLNDWPEVGLWISIIVGVFAKGETWSFFQDLLRLFCGRLKTLTWDDVQSVLHEFQPISSEPFLRCCRSFWLSAMALKSVQILLGQMRDHAVTASEIT